MTGFFNPKQIRCEHCGFEFIMTGFGSAAKIVCLACGKETMVSPPKPAARKPVFPEIVSKSETESLLCSVEQCPLLTHSEAGSEIAERVKLRLLQRAQRRRNILAWTVMLQVCVLIGVMLFAAKPFLVHDVSDEGLPVQPIADVEHEPDTEEPIAESSSPVYISPPPLPMLPTTVPEQTEIVEHDTFASDPFAPVGEHASIGKPGFAVSPFETAQHVFAPPMFETFAENAENGEEIGDAVPVTPLPPPEPITLEKADRLLHSAKTSLTVDPEDSVRQAAQAARIYEELGQPLPESLYWIVGNAFASLSWGEPLLESSPVVETMTLSADSRYLLAQLRDKTVWLWDLQSSDGERAGYLLDKGTAEYVKFVFSPDLRWIIGGQENGIVRIWDMSLRNPADTLITFVERAPDLQDLQISPNGHWLVAFGCPPRSTASRFPDQFDAADSLPHPVLLWNLRQMEAGVVPIATPIPLNPQPVQVVRFSPNSDRLAIGGKDAVVHVYDLAMRGIGAESFVLRGHQLGITQIVFAPCGQWLATGSQDNTVRLWNLTGSQLSPESATLTGHIGWISALTIDRTGGYVLSGSFDRTIRIWSVKHGNVQTALHTQPIVLKTNLGIPESLTLTQDGDKMIVLGSEGSLGIYHLPSLLEDDPEDYYRAVTFRNSRLSISKSLLTSDDQLLIFSYEHLLHPSNNGIRLWALQAEAFVR